MRDVNFFETIDSKEKAYILGWIASDGYVDKQHIEITLHKKDIEVLEYIKNTLDPTISLKNKDPYIRFRICSIKQIKDVCNHLEINPGKKSHCVKTPKNLPDELMFYFLRGVLEGDGSIRKFKKDCSKKHPSVPRFKITSASIDFCNEIRDFSKKNNVNSYLYQSKKYANYVEWSGKAALKFLDSIYLNADFEDCKMQRKYELYKFWKEKSKTESKWLWK